jgi:hypothetical protein
MKMFNDDSRGAARTLGRSGHPRPDNSRQKAIESIDWFQQGMKCLEMACHKEALFCFEEAKRFGHPKTTKAIAYCRKQLEERLLDDEDSPFE